MHGKKVGWLGRVKEKRRRGEEEEVTRKIKKSLSLLSSSSSLLPPPFAWVVHCCGFLGLIKREGKEEVLFSAPKCGSRQFLSSNLVCLLGLLALHNSIANSTLSPLIFSQQFIEIVFGFYAFW